MVGILSVLSHFESFLHRIDRLGARFWSSVRLRGALEEVSLGPFSGCGIPRRGSAVDSCGLAGPGGGLRGGGRRACGAASQWPGEQTAVRAWLGTVGDRDRWPVSLILVCISAAGLWRSWGPRSLSAAARSPGVV